MRTFKAILLAACFASLLAGGELPRPADPLTLNTIDGQEISLEELRGKVVLVMFFSTDCPHCQKTSQQIAPIYKAWKPRGLEVLGFAINPAASKNLESFALQYDAKYPVGLSNRKEWTSFAGVSLMSRLYVPYVLIVDRKGQIREIHPGRDRAFWRDLETNLPASLDALLKEPGPTS